MYAAMLLLFAGQIAPSSAPGQAVVRAAVTPPRSPRPLQQLISPDDYPAEARARHEQGVVGVILDITPNGRVAACKILKSSGSAVLDSWTCRIVQRRARLTPARDAGTGRPVAGQYADVVRWDLASARR